MVVAQNVGRIARVFVAVNRVFGYLVFAGGVAFLVQAAWALFNGASLARAGVATGLGALLCLIGWLYIRAPLRRQREAAPVVSAPVGNGSGQHALPNTSLERTRER